MVIDVQRAQPALLAHGDGDEIAHFDDFSFAEMINPRHGDSSMHGHHAHLGLADLTNLWHYFDLNLTDEETHAVYRQSVQNSGSGLMTAESLLVGSSTFHRRVLEEESDDIEELKKENTNENPSESDTPISDEDIILKLNEEISNLKDQRLRAIAELENFRKRAEKDQSDALKYGIANFAKEIINIKDNIERAQSSISDEVKTNEAVKSVVEGLDLIAQATVSTFEKIGIKKVESINQKFDHNLHQAMMEIEKDEMEPGTIVQEILPGYTLHDRLLRPAMVGVSKNTQENQDNKDKKNEETE